MQHGFCKLAYSCINHPQSKSISVYELKFFEIYSKYFQGQYIICEPMIRGVAVLMQQSLWAEAFHVCLVD